MKINKILQPFIITLFLYLLFGFFDISFFDNYICDSGSINENINENVDNFNENNNDNDGDTTARDFTKLHLMDRIRRRLS